MLPNIYATNNQGFFPTIFNEFFNGSWMMPKYHATTPAINVSETEQAYKVEVAAPGMTRNDFSIQVTNEGDMVISMEKKAEVKDENKDKKYLRREFSYSKFEQRLSLPENVEKQNISAQMTDGILTIVIPKMTEEQKAEETKFIEIK
ncbi:MAG: Hsp20/alpha crystallin family protein [Bacteroidaceae bacterium]|nr:Hsp20/alpha crystallin family protein [Candidatus Minthousia equi]MCQ2246841.1 Hsp20/alpha crystallin family protein [Bacteroidaceae bacterium]MDO4957153.1 Hsp20/alpha crystallin family protein [Bacteroidales bacterium]